MEKIKISVYNLYKNNINYNMIGGAGVASLADATLSANAAAKADAKARMQLAIAQADLQQQLAQAKFNQAKGTDVAKQLLATNQFNQAKATEAARQQLARDQFNQAKATEAARQATEAARQQIARDQLAETTASRQQRFELDKARFDAENYTLADCKKDITEYKFYNLRNQIEMNTLQSNFGKTKDEIKDLLKTNNFDFVQVKNQLAAEAAVSEGKIRVKVHRFRK